MDGTGPKRVLNVGGNNKETALPPEYRGWTQILLDIDARGQPDIVCDAREMLRLPACEFDAVYCSHNLEHYYRHDASKVLRGFLHVLKGDGFAHIRVPDLQQLMQFVVQNNIDIDDPIYRSAAGPITAHDVIYGYNVEIERSGNDFYAHKAGFTPKSLPALLTRCGFPYVFSRAANLEIVATAFRNPPTEFARNLLGLPAG